MTLRKITNDNSVRWFSKDDHSHSEYALLISKVRDNKPNTRMKNVSKNKLSQDKKKFFQNLKGGGFRIIK